MPVLFSGVCVQSHSGKALDFWRQNKFKFSRTTAKKDTMYGYIWKQPRINTLNFFVEFDVSGIFIVRLDANTPQTNINFPAPLIRLHFTL